MALPQNVIDAQTNATNLATKAGEYATALPTIGDELKKRVNTLYNDNADVLGLFNQGVTDLAAAPGKSYDMFSNVTDPYARERLASQFVQTQSLPAMTAAGQLGQRMGNISDIVNAGTNAFQAQATASQSAAQIARQNYEDALNQWQVVENARLQQEQLDISRANAGGGGFTLNLGNDNKGGNTPAGTPASASALFNDIVANVKATGGNEYHVWKYITDNATTLKHEGFYDDLINMQKALKNQYGTMPLNSNLNFSSPAGSTLGKPSEPANNGLVSGINLGNMSISGLNTGKLGYGGGF